MPLFAVERDLSQVPPDRFRTELQGLLAACERLQGLGKRVRYISSAVFPADARGLCLFGAEQPQWVSEANEAAHLPYLRIFPVLDLTPSGVCRDLSRGRRPAHADGASSRDGTASPRTATRVTEELTRWSEEGRRLLQVLAGWIEDAGDLHGEVASLESERATLTAEVRRLVEENEALRTQRDDLLEALQTLARQMTRASDEILFRFGGRREAPGDLAPR